MCTAALSMAGQGFGAAQGAVGSYFGASSAQSSLRYQAQMAQVNAQLADQQSRQTLAASEKTQAEIGMKGAQVKAAQTAGMASQGVDVGVGSAVQVRTSTDYVTAVDRQQAQLNGMLAAFGHQTEALNYRNEAAADQAKASTISPLMAGASSLISSAGQVAKSWYDSKSAGAFGSTGQNLNTDFSNSESMVEAQTASSNLPLKGWGW